MEQAHRDLITRNLGALIRQTEFDLKLETKLIESQIFPVSKIEELRTLDGDEKKRKLYLDVQRRGPKAFLSLLNALVESENSSAAHILDSQVEIVQKRLPDKVWNPPNYQEEHQEQQQQYVPPPILPNSTQPLLIKVKKSDSKEETQAKLNALKIYPMRAKPRGLVLIIDNEDFQQEVLPTRTGSLVDANNLDLLFGELGFRVTLRRNLGYHDMITEVQKFSARTEDHQAADMAVVAILSHGRHGLIAAADGRELETEWVLRQFNNDGCPALKGKPKLFIFQACRGDETDYGVMPRITFSEDRTASDARKVIPAAVEMGHVYKEVSWEDMIIAYATLPGYVANRDRYRGTWFIECLCSVFMEFAANTDLRDMLDIVAERLKNYESEMGTKQTFAYEVRHFYKKLFFNPE